MILSAITKITFAVLFTLPFALYQIFTGILWQNLLISTVVFFLTALPHELLHWVGHRLAGVDAKLGWARGAFGSPTLAVLAQRPQTLWSYRIAVALPGLALGVMPLVLGALSGTPLWVLVGLVGISMASSDIALLVFTLRWPGHCLVQDHPQAVGVLRLD